MNSNSIILGQITAGLALPLKGSVELALGLKEGGSLSSWSLELRAM